MENKTFRSIAFLLAFLFLVNRSFAQDEDWFLEGTTDVPHAITDNIYTYGNVGVDINLPTARLDVNGQLKVRLLSHEPTADKLLVADPNGFVKYALRDDIFTHDLDWLKPDNQPALDINDAIYTNKGVGININDPEANLDIIQLCNNRPAFKIHRGPLNCIFPNDFGNLIHVEGDNTAFPNPSIDLLMIMNYTGRMGIGTDAGNDSRVKICHSPLYGSALSVYKTPMGVNDITTEIRIGNSPYSNNMIALSVNNGDCNGTGTPILEIEGNGMIAVFASPSDIRYKEGITALEKPLEKLSKLRGVTYTFQQENTPWAFPKGKQTGLIAQEVEEVIPDAVYDHPSGFKAVSYDKVIPLVVEAVKARQQQLEAKQSLISEMKEQAAQLRAYLDKLCIDNAGNCVEHH